MPPALFFFFFSFFFFLDTLPSGDFWVTRATERQTFYPSARYYGIITNFPVSTFCPHTSLPSMSLCAVTNLDIGRLLLVTRLERKSSYMGQWKNGIRVCVLTLAKEQRSRRTAAFGSPTPSSSPQLGASPTPRPGRTHPTRPKFLPSSASS